MMDEKRISRVSEVSGRFYHPASSNDNGQGGEGGRGEEGCWM